MEASRIGESLLAHVLVPSKPANVSGEEVSQLLCFTCDHRTNGRQVMTLRRQTLSSIPQLMLA